MKTFKAIAAIALGVIGLLASSCGLLFLWFSSMEGWHDPWPIAIVIVGGLLIGGAVVLLRSATKSTQGATAAPHPDDIPPAD